MYNPSERLVEVLQCKNCGWFIGNPNDKMYDGPCCNCGVPYKKSKSIIEKVSRIENGKIITEGGNKI